MPDRWEVPEGLRRQMVEVARQFRKNPTPGERVLWELLRGRRLGGVKFRRQAPLGPFVVDFFAASHRLIVEVDGPIHDDQVEPDRRRQELLESLGLRFCRVRTEVVEQDLSSALALIRSSLAGAHTAPGSSSSPSPLVGEGVGG